MYRYPLRLHFSGDADNYFLKNGCVRDFSLGRAARFIGMHADSPVA